MIELQNINQTLERQNEIMRQMLDIMPKPANRFIKVLTTAVLIVGVFSMITLVDVVIKWITGG